MTLQAVSSRVRNYILFGKYASVSVHVCLYVIGKHRIRKPLKFHPPLYLYQYYSMAQTILNQARG